MQRIFLLHVSPSCVRVVMVQNATYSNIRLLFAGKGFSMFLSLSLFQYFFQCKVCFMWKHTLPKVATMKKMKKN